jgi:hypothetical protein
MLSSAKLSTAAATSLAGTPTPQSQQQLGDAELSLNQNTLNMHSQIEKKCIEVCLQIKLHHA